MTTLILDMTQSGNGDFDPIDPGFYQLQVEKVREPKETRSRFYDFANHPDEQPYEDNRGYLVYPYQTSVLIEMRPIADVQGDLDDEDVIYQYFNLNPSKFGKGLRPNQKLRALLEACGVSSGNTDELIGATCWATVGHVTNDDGSFKKFDVSGYTNQAPKRRQRKAAAPQPEPVEDAFPEDEIPFDDAGDDSVSTTGPQTEDDWIALIRDATNLDQLKGIGDALRAANAGTDEVRKTYQKRLMSFRATTRPTP